MRLLKPISNLLYQLEDSISSLSDEQYNTPVAVLSGTSIGQHLRHVIEFFAELRTGYDKGIVNYDNRKRNQSIESDRNIALEKIQETIASFQQVDKPLTLIASFPVNGINDVTFESNYNRELLYNLEHTVHHMAIIRIGIEAVSVIKLSDQFGVAESTVEFRKACAQ